MQIVNTGTETLTLSVAGNIVVLKPTQACEMTESQFDAFRRLFPALEWVELAADVKEPETTPKEVKHVVKNKKQRK